MTFSYVCIIVLYSHSTPLLTLVSPPQIISSFYFHDFIHKHTHTHARACMSAPILLNLDSTKCSVYLFLPVTLFSFPLSFSPFFLPHIPLLLSCSPHICMYVFIYESYIYKYRDFDYERKHRICVFSWLISFNMVIYSSIQFPENDLYFIFYNRMEFCCVYITISLSIHLVII